jgi:CheY-like chemotaxis protein
VLKAGERATKQVRQLRAFSRKQTLKLEMIELNELNAGLLKMLGRVIGEHINLSVRPGHGLKPICADAGQIEQIIMNLCVNARDAMPKGGKLTIETKSLRVDEGFCHNHVDARIGDYVVLSISDTGEGIDPEIQTSIFEPFFTTKGPGEGTGLGLATVYAITQRHEGFIDLYSESGHGTTLRVYLPAQESSDEQQSDDERSVENLRGNETILIAEDNQQVRILARRILESAGYKVILARDGHEAMRLFELNIDSIDLALLDVIMPGASGGAVLEKIRARKPDIPVLLSSGYSDDVLKSADLPDSEYRMLHKPYSTEELLAQVRRMLDQDKSRPV